MAAPALPERPTVGEGAARPPSSGPFSRLLLAVDVGHPPGPEWTGVVRELVARFDAELVACHVVLRATSVAGNELDGAPANAEEEGHARALRALLVDRLGEPGHRVSLKILHGDPGERIAEYAAFARCDLIVLEAAPRSIAHRLKGSVSRYVVGAADRSVLVVAPHGRP